MKVVMLMFDSLNRHMLPPYGCDWIHAPNFARLAQRTVTFDRSYVCSMPCMPARRDLHTARPNFMHRSWGPVEPWDDSIPQMLKEAGVSSHLITDHYHYLEDGGATYHNRYSTWECFRGQEGDPCYAMLDELPPIDAVGRNAMADDAFTRQDRINRGRMPDESDQPQSKTIAAGVDFINRNHDKDRWFLQIETFDPHEPFFTQRKYKDLYAEHYNRYRAAGGKIFDWPLYHFSDETPEQVEHLRYEYASLLSMCDAKLGDVLDAMDANNMWEDTMLIVCTDHGFLLGEHDCCAKIWMPFFEEVSHTPFFVWDPRSGRSNVRSDALVQPAVDIGPTVLEVFGLERTPDMRGHDLSKTLTDDSPVRKAGIFGVFGAQLNVTDGRYVYMRAPANEDNQPLFEHTLMPTSMRSRFSVDSLQDMTLAKPLSFTKGIQPLKIPTGRKLSSHPGLRQNLLYDVQADPHQQHPIEDAAIESRMTELLKETMAYNDAPPEQYDRLGLA